MSHFSKLTLRNHKNSSFQIHFDKFLPIRLKFKKIKYKINLQNNRLPKNNISKLCIANNACEKFQPIKFENKKVFQNPETRFRKIAFYLILSG